MGVFDLIIVDEASQLTLRNYLGLLRLVKSVSFDFLDDLTEMSFDSFSQVVLAGDHIYKMNYKPMVEFHRKMGADCTIGTLRVNRSEAGQFGVMQTDGEHRVIGFQEKPEDPIGTAEDPDVSLASMGIYVFNAEFLYEQLCNDATLADSDHDFGKNIIPGAIGEHQICARERRGNLREILSIFSSSVVRERLSSTQALSLTRALRGVFSGSASTCVSR